MKRRLIRLLTSVTLVVSLLGTTVMATETNIESQISSENVIHPLTEEDAATDNPDYLITPRAGNTTIYKYNTGGKTLETVLGCSREDILKVLGNHVNDSYYLNTPYAHGDHRNPNGDPADYGSLDRYGTPVMNCTGFVWHVLSSAGGSGVPATSGWVTLLERNKIEYRTYVNYSSVNDLINTILEDDFITPGDIIWTWDARTSLASTGLSHGSSSFHHTGIYIGNYFDDIHTTGANWMNVSNSNDRWWHSTDYKAASKGFSGNQTTNISPITSCNAITVVKTSEARPDIYPDVTSSSWYYSYVKDVTDAGIMNGYEDGYFYPDTPLTRGQFAAILYRTAGSPASDYAFIFSDVFAHTYYSVPVTWGLNEGLIHGYASGEFKPNNSITREQLAVMMYRYAVWTGQNVTAYGDYTTFPDGDAVSEYAQTAMNWAIGKGIIQGNKEGYLLPQGSATRAECAAILSRYLGL